MPAEKVTTKEKILNATEHLLAERGFDAVSLRDITNRAEVNVAAVNYHFGSKEKLFEAVQCQCMNPINEQRIQLLESLTAGGQVAGIRDILDAFMRPFLTMTIQSELKEQVFYKLMGRCLSDQHQDIPDAALPLLDKMVADFSRAISAALPHLPVDQQLWRLHYSFGVMIHTLMYADTVQKLTKGACGEPDMEQQLEWMIDFCHAGFLNKEEMTS
ncbi:TetR family transcriptional regulator [Verrucomicrobiaceae bacterium R5-34]|uniref:TetR family transcriptional regulator n=1 Tax=Oceaniferula flava TaxID=2800421 RepID=A0AAE2SA90_9BACT|nr:TetR/AcrR family transcriptional regulator [Oceaniferula flavus]MBK1829674.1 TetR family transcriptional regulator [Verrucomicrobiaceae bacterium R5-34]MBK1853864.1 TetR family transcriptional regulator [Oceaniferula flavus]MBM1135170.1 TetR family transcriptional regulator [Oceaniferula flavus]